MKHTTLATAVAFALSAATTAAPAVADDAESKIEKLIVTGQKIDRELQDTPTSVAVMTNKQIEQQQLMNMHDILEQIPNVNGRSGQDFSIRGVDVFNVSGGGNSYLGSVYVDGAALPYRMVQKGGFSAWDVSQVEVLRGPQSTLQGRNALAGAIVMRTTRPAYEWGGKARVTYGQNGQQEFAGALGGELLDNQLAFRISAERNEFGGNNYNTTRKEESGYNDNHTYRFKLLWEPSDDFSALLSYTENESDLGVLWINARVNNVPKADPYSDRTVDFNDPTNEFTKNKILNLEIEYDINDEWAFTSITTRVDADYGYRWDGDASPQSGSVLIDNRNDKTLSQELRFVYQGDALSGVMGAYYSDLKVKDLFFGNRPFSFQQLGVRNLLISNFGLSPALADTVLGFYRVVDPVILDNSGDTVQKVSTAAVYADFTYVINDHWEVYGGLRYDTEKQENSAVTKVTVGNANLLPDPANFAFNPALAQLVAGINANLLKQAADASGTEPLTDEDFSAWLPKLGVTYNWNEDMSAHFTYQRGYRSGGVGTNLARNNIFTYDPEYTNNYELSFRSVWLDGDLVANANLFWLDWEDQQVRVQLSSNSFDNETRNAGASDVKGFELELFYNLDENWRINAGIGNAKSNFKKFTVNVNGRNFDLSGRSFATAPEWTANLSANYQNDGWFANVNANYADGYKTLVNPYVNGLVPDANGALPTDPNFDPEGDSRVLVNTRFGYNWGTWSLALNVTNVFDEQYVINPDTLPQTTSQVPTLRLGEERQIGATITFSF